MRTLQVLACSAAAVCCAAWAVAQAVNEEPELPPVIVRPAEEPLPPPPATDPYDLPLSYPRLSRQLFGASEAVGLDSAVRGEKSVFDLPSLGTVIDRQLIVEKQPADMARLLQNEVGVLVQHTARGQASPFVRGLTGQEVLILIDGVRLNNSIFRFGPNQYFNLIDPGQVERVEIVRGPQSVLWGSDAIGGVINVVTRSADPLAGNYASGGFTEYFSTADLASYTRAGGEAWYGNWGVFGGASYLNVHDLDRGGGLGRQPFTNYDQYAGDVKFNSLLGEDHLLTVALQHFEQQDVPRSDRFLPFVLGPPASTPRPTFFDPQQRDLAYVRLQGLGYNALFDAYTTTVLYGRNKEGSREIRSATRTDLGEFDVDTIGYNLTLARDLGDLGRFTYGGDFYYDDVGASRFRFNPATGSLVQDNPPIPDDARYHRAGGFINWDVWLTERWSTMVGARYEMAQAHGTINAVSGTPVTFDRSYQDWIASVGMGYLLTAELQLVGNISEGFRAPNLDDLTTDNTVQQASRDIPSLHVQPEHSRTYEVGLKLDTPRFRGQVFQFWNDLQDKIQRQAVDAAGNPVPDVIGPNGTRVPGSSNFIRINSDAYIYGTEMYGEYLLPEGWSLYGNFWYTFGQDVGRGQPLSRMPPAQGIMGLRWRETNGSRWFDVYTWLVHRQDRYAPENNIDSRFPLGGTPGYATLNMRMGTRLGRGGNHRLSMTLENMTDKLYRVLGSGIDGPGFNAILGWSWIR